MGFEMMDVDDDKENDEILKMHVGDRFKIHLSRICIEKYIKNFDIKNLLFPCIVLPKGLQSFAQNLWIFVKNVVANGSSFRFRFFLN